MRARGPGAGRGIAFRLVLLGLTALAVDLVLYGFVARLGREHNVFWELELPSAGEIERFRDEFHPRWGWDLPPHAKDALGARRGRERVARDEFMLQLHGDSFSFGAEVGERDTFAYRVEEQTGWECLNFAVGAYGTDQALLKYRDSPYRSRYAVLGVLDENIGRVVTNAWRFYHPRGGIPGTKPRFVLEAGRLRLLPNPIQRLEELPRLAEAGFYEELRAHDDWRRYYLELGAPARLRWPALRTLAGHFGFWTRELGNALALRLRPSYAALLSRRRYYLLYERDAEALRLFEAIVDEFVREAGRRGETPIVLLLPVHSTVEARARFGASPFQRLVRHVAERGAPSIDVETAFAGEDYERYYLGPAGHFSPAGHARVAELLIERVRELERQRPALAASPELR